MRLRVKSKRAGVKLATLVSVVAALFLMAAGTAAAADTTETFNDSVTFIGDSVTAGFGYCGTENAKNVTCGPNGEMADRWTIGKNSLDDCAPKDPPEIPNDACSNNNFNGKPWSAPNGGAWTPGPNAPRIAYPYQLAAAQPAGNAAEVRDWAVTGGTPDNWDPQGGAFGSQIDKINHQYVVMTLGANPLLSYFTNIKLQLKTISGRCVGDTGYSESSWVFFSKWYSGPISNATDCLRREWARLDQTEHLVRIYSNLLAQGNRIVVLGYYRDCSWSFGNWQPNANPWGPASGKECKGQTRPISPGNSTEISQWDQAVAVGNELNNLISDAVDKAKDVARQQWPDSGRAGNIVYTAPDPKAWEAHQPKSDNGSWVLLQDTWIHPNKAGAGNLADTVAQAMCSSFGHWCGKDQGWN
jgi:hypothetical protein